MRVLEGIKSRPWGSEGFDGLPQIGESVPFLAALATCSGAPPSFAVTFIFLIVNAHFFSIIFPVRLPLVAIQTTGGQCAC